MLTDSRALFAPYLIALLFAAFTLYKSREMSFEKRSISYRIVCIVSVIFAALLTLANYSLWMDPKLPDIRSSLFVRIVKLLYVCVIFSGFFVSCLNILRYVCFNKDAFAIKKPEDRQGSFRFFIIPFAIISVIYLTIFVCCYYPGLMSLDSIDQVKQLFTHKYSNHQPFYHTQLLGIFIRPGLSIFGNMNAAVATYTVFQILFMAMTFSFVTYNMALLKMPLWSIVTSTVGYAVMPFHIMFSFTVWKDVYFGAFTTLLIVFFIRIMKDLGKRPLNLALFSVSGLVMCLIRSNGLFAYIFVFIAILLLARKEKDIMIAMITVILAAFIFKHPVLNSLNVTQPDTVESLSIPLQQISRTIADDGVMSDEDKAILSNIIDVSSIKDTYDPDISDPVKNAIRDFGNQKYLSDNMGRSLFPGTYPQPDEICRGMDRQHMRILDQRIQLLDLVLGRRG